ncbi:hypothetical protein BH23GEM7_BH23GEM7_33460 [soil metagenome]
MADARIARLRFALAIAAVLLPPALPAQDAIRLPDGRPGPGYWQQQVDYSVEARLEPQARQLTGRARITYHNSSPDTLHELHWHLYQNIFRGDSPARGVEQILGRRMAATRGITVHRVTADGRPLDREIAGTLMRTPLREPLGPGDSLLLQVEWEYEVPPIPTLRTGSRGEDFGMAQWYPQIAVYDDRHGWNDTPYVGTGEFYLEYGAWDVRITVPSNYLVAATGTLRNPEQLLTSVQLRRLQEVTPGRVTQVVTAADLEARAAEAPPAERTWHFTARDVRDFAWAASPDFIWDATRTAPLPLQPEGVWIHSFYRPDEARAYRSSAWVASRAIEYWSRRFGPYLYPQATVVSGPVEGMEYPMLAFGGPASRIDNQPLMVIVHELAHQWYPMMLGTHETRYPAMDEGMTTFITSLALEDLFGRGSFWSPRLPYFMRGVLGSGDERRILQAAYLLDAGSERDFRLLTHAHALDEWQLGLQVYVKTASVLFMLRDVLGDEAFERALQAYHERWHFKHPYPEDFFRTVEDVGGRELEWFWQPWFRGTATLDLALREVTQEQDAGGWSARITLENRGDAIMPATVRLTLRDGGVRDVRVPETVWMNGARTHTVEVAELPARVRAAEIDPARILADAWRSNNVWPAGTPSAAGPLLGMSWQGMLLMLLGAGLAVAAARVSGTFVSARRSGARVVRYGLGRLTLWTAARGWRVGWTGWLFGGGTLSLPPGRLVPDELRRRLAGVAAGGAAGGLMLAAVGAFLVAALELAGRLALRPEGHHRLDSVLATTVALALLSVLLSLRPRPALGYLPDHPWLRLLRLSGPRAERWAATRALLAASWAGRRPREWEERWIATATELHDRSRAEAGACLLAYLWAMDRDEVGLAAEYLIRAEHATRGWSQRRLRRVVLTEQAFIAAFVRDDPGAARSCLDGAGARGVPRHLRSRAEAALALATKEGPAADRIASAALDERQRIAARAGAGIATFEEEWLRQIVSNARAAATKCGDETSRPPVSPTSGRE